MLVFLIQQNVKNGEIEKISLNKDKTELDFDPKRQS